MSQLEPINLPVGGPWVLAVSGGLDSVVLLDAVAAAGLPVIVAHFDHRMRADSALDTAFVEQLVRGYGLPFQAGLAADTLRTEAEARAARYAYLEWLAEAQGAVGIMTAHHLDDRIETSIMNIMRGAGPRGVASLTERPGLSRPMLEISRRQIEEYATLHRLKWREDLTNADTGLLRNFVRHKLLPLASSVEPDFYAMYHSALSRLDLTNAALTRQCDQLLKDYLVGGEVHFPRLLLPTLRLPALETLLASAAAAIQTGHQLDAPRLRQAALFAKTATTGKIFEMEGGLRLIIERPAVRLYLIKT